VGPVEAVSAGERAAGRPVGQSSAVINGILYRVRTGIPWRDLPVRFGPWTTVYDRHRRWCADGTWDRILTAVQAAADAEGRLDWSLVGIDSTSCRAHQHAAGARKEAPKVRRKGGSRNSTGPTRASGVHAEG